MVAKVVRLSEYRLAVGAESYPHYDDEVNDVYEEDEGGLSTPTCPHPDNISLADQVAEMGLQLRCWGVSDWRRFTREADPVLLAQSIAVVESAVAEGAVRSPGGLFRWSMRQSGFMC